MNLGELIRQLTALQHVAGDDASVDIDLRDDGDYMYVSGVSPVVLSDGQIVAVVLKAKGR